MSIRTIIRNITYVPSYFYNWMQLKYRHVEYGKNLRIRGKLFCVTNTPGGIVIGDNVSINSCRKANPIGGDTKTILFAKNNGIITIGNDCGISNSTIFACEKIVIQNGVRIGGSVKIYDTDFHWLNSNKRITEDGGATKPVTIKEKVFIGAHSIVLKGVTIGERSIIGAGSVVTKDVPPGEIWAGNPARFIRKIDEVQHCENVE